MPVSNRPLAAGIAHVRVGKPLHSHGRGPVRRTGPGEQRGRQQQPRVPELRVHGPRRPQCPQQRLLLGLVGDDGAGQGLRGGRRVDSSRLGKRERQETTTEARRN